MKYKIRNKILTLSISLLLAPLFAFAGNISAGSNLGYGWSENAGYVNFGLSAGNVTVADTTITGYIWDSIYGWMNLGPINIGGVDYGVKNDSKGNLSGFAWSTGAGWIPFSGAIINSSGKFTGITTNSSIYGRISFDCAYCNVVTTWRAKAQSNVLNSISGSYPINNIPEEIPTVVPLNFNVPIERSNYVKINNRKRNIIVDEGQGGVFNVVQNENEASLSINEELTNPNKLFDIEFLADRNTIDDSSKLITRVKLVSFGKVKTNILMIFTVEDSKGNILFKDTGNMDVETEGVYVEKYKNLLLPNGVYKAKLHTLYNGNVEDDFSLNFEVKKSLVATSIKEIFWPILIIIPLLVLVMFKIILERRKK